MSGTRSKSPSRIPVSSSMMKRGTGPSSTLKANPTPSGQLSGLKKLQALAKADARSRNLSPSQLKAVTKIGVPWVDKYLPKSLDELFVHKKKVEEVIFWMNRVFTSSNIRGNNICVVNGPAGCGKTAAVHLVAAHLKADIKEWSNPMNLTEYQQFRSEDFRDEVQGRSQIDLFTDFLFRTSQYKAIQMKGKSANKNRLIVVEDIPNIFYRDTNLFHDVLRRYSSTGTTPLVFIFTDSSASDHSMYKMFPKTFINELRINNISMNPVAASLMVKFLLDICLKESVPVDRSQVEEVAATANGDLRCAVNNLQFTLTNERVVRASTFRKPVAKKGRKGEKGTTGASETQQKDDTIQLFRALGKVLYGKRDESAINECEYELTGEMEKDRRVHPLLENPDVIGEKMEVSADTFLSFLHQNYPAFFGSMDDMRNAAEYLSDGDFVLSGWKFDDSGNKNFKVRDVKDQVAMSTTIRGLMHANNNRVSVGWKPLTKPLVSNLEKETRESVESTRQALFHLRELQTTLFTEAIPLYAKLLKLKPSTQTALGSGSKEIIAKGIFQRKNARVVTLDEKETVEDTDEVVETSDSGGEFQDAQTASSKQSATDLGTNNFSTDNNLGDEEFLIEEFE